jgi:hypothetical protein
MTHPIPYISASLPLDFRNQKPALMAIGILMILLGAFFGCMTAVIPFSIVMMRSGWAAGNAMPPVASLIMAVGLYAAVAILLIWCGIGCILARRWVRPVLIVFSTLAIVTGVLTSISLIIAAVTLPSNGMTNVVTWTASTTGPATATSTAVPSAAQRWAVMFSAVVTIIFLVALPAALFWFMRLPSVRQTVEHFDPAYRWTDARPFPVMAISLTCWIWAPLLLSQSASGVVTFFGIILDGVIGMIAPLVLGVVVAVAGVLVWKQRAAGWWLVMILCVGIFASSLVSALFGDVDAMLAAMDLPPEALAQARQMAISNPNSALLALAVMLILAIIYLLRHRGYFVNQTPPHSQAVNDAG